MLTVLGSRKRKSEIFGDQGAILNDSAHSSALFPCAKDSPQGLQFASLTGAEQTCKGRRNDQVRKNEPPISALPSRDERGEELMWRDRRIALSEGDTGNRSANKLSRRRPSHLTINLRPPSPKKYRRDWCRITHENVSGWKSHCDAMLENASSRRWFGTIASEPRIVGDIFATRSTASTEPDGKDEWR